MMRLAFMVVSCGLVASPFEAGPAQHRIQVGEAVTPHVFEGDVRDLPRPRFWRPGDPVGELEQFHDPHASIPRVGPISVDPLLVYQANATSVTDGFSVPTRDFEGIGYTGLAVPDSVGDVGPSHYVQGANGFSTQQGSFVRIFDKASPTPHELATFQMRDLGGPVACLSVFGDPVVLYDRPADRWVLAEVAGTDVCVYVSQTSDPVAGGWFSYVFTASGGVIADYPKLAVWPTDANDGPGTYVATTNEDGPAVYALDRGAMLAGLPATPVRISLPPLPAFNHQDALMPHPVGPDPPPAKAPVPILRHRDTELHGGTAVGDLLEMWILDVDWIDPGNTTLTPVSAIDIADFDSTPCSPTSLSCFPQPGPAPAIHPLHEPLMYRLNYVNRGSFESLVGNFTVDADGQDHGGIRWFELRRPNVGAWTLYQEGTYAVDSSHRWMGSIGADRRGNLALGFNLTSETIFPGLLYTGRRWFDPPGVMTVDEVSLAAGSGTVATNRYGDYSLMALDPVDDCTFWFTGEYSVVNEWRTRIATFSFDSCGCAEPTVPTLQAAVPTDNRIRLSWGDAPEAGVTEYVLQRSRTEGGPYETIATVVDSSPGTGGGSGYVFDDTGVSGGTTYFYVLIANSGTCPSDPSIEAVATATGLCKLPPVFDGLAVVSSSAFDTCRVDLSWSPAQPECAGPLLYNIYRSTTAGFTPSVANLLVAGMAGSSAIDVNGLQHGITYAYIVRAVDAGNGMEDGNLVERSVVVGGPNSGTQLFFDEDFADSPSLADWTLSVAAGSGGCLQWEHTDSAFQRPSYGGGFYARAEPDGCGPVSGTTLDSPLVDLSFAGLQTVVLQVDVYYNQLAGGAATIQVRDGTSWPIQWADPNFDVNERLLLDVTGLAVGNPAFQVRLSYRNAANDNWFSVDNVRLITTADVACSTSPAPPPTPDGSAGTQPLFASRQDTAGTAIDVSYDAESCPAAAYHLVYGDLDTLSSYAFTGSECDIGPGTFSWTGVPPGNLYFLVLGSDGLEIESSWGQGPLGERGGLSSSGQCGSVAKDITATCP